MERKTIRTGIRKWFKKTNKLARDIMLSFDPGDIHAFRLGFKKQRAFLRLLGGGKKKNTGIPKPIKAFYKNVGVIRDLELHRDFLQRNGQAHWSKPFKYIELLNNKIQRQKEWMSEFSWN